MNPISGKRDYYDQVKLQDIRGKVTEIRPIDTYRKITVDLESGKTINYAEGEKKSVGTEPEAKSK